MRIAVIGPQNTGKSTFVKDFLDNFTHYTTPDKSYREHVTSIGLPINQGTNEESQEAILNFLFDQTIKYEGKNVIFDRCVVDNYAYTHAAYLHERVSKAFVLHTKRRMYEQLAHLDALFFIPTTAGVKLVEDTFRDVDIDFVDLINRMFMETLFDISHRSHIPIFVITGNRQDRIEQVKRHIF